MSELAAFGSGSDLLAWAKASLPLKNALQAADAHAVEAAYQNKLGEAGLGPIDTNVPITTPEDASAEFRNGEGAGREQDDQDQARGQARGRDQSQNPGHDPGPDPSHERDVRQAAPVAAKAGLACPKEPPRKRSKAHLLFVRGQPCLICKREPADAHHLKFAQPRALGRKVSDEFTVPLCRPHHHDLHRRGNERAWWANMQVDPLPAARELWAASPIHGEGSTTSVGPASIVAKVSSPGGSAPPGL